MRRMTAKQRRFCDEYLIDLNATQAAIRSGYSKKTAYSIGEENLKKPEIKAYIAERMAEKESELIADQDEVLRYLTSVMRGVEKDEVFGMGEDGVFGVQKVRRQVNQIEAAKLLGKRYGLYTDRVEQDVDMDLNITVNYGDGDSV